mgnify:CR=1 FL=1
MTREEFLKLISSKDTPIETLIDLAKSEDTPSEFLIELAKYRKWKVRYEVACNPKSPIEALEILSDDKVERVWRAVGGNPSTPQEIHIKLSVKFFSVGNRIKKKKT